MLEQDLSFYRGPIHVKAAYEKLKAASLPFGIRIELHEPTANILVLSDNYGFSVSSLWCKEHIDTIVEDVKIWLYDLLRAEGCGPMIYTLEEIKKQAASPTVFDALPGVTNGR